MSSPLDPRRYAYRADLAADSLREMVVAESYAAGEVHQVVHSSTPLRAEPNPRGSWTTEVLFGELLLYFLSQLQNSRTRGTIDCIIEHKRAKKIFSGRNSLG